MTRSSADAVGAPDPEDGAMDISVVIGPIVGGLGALVLLLGVIVTFLEEVR